MKLRYILLTVLAVAATQIALADICRSVSTGDWNDPTTWDCGHEPGCGDTIYVSSDHTVTVTDHVELDEDFGCNTPSYIVVQDRGTLHFQSGKKMHLACNSGVTVESGGQITAGGGGGSSNLIDICNSTVWDAGDGTASGPTSFGSPLPIELLFFNAVVVDEQEVYIAWQTASEQNNDYFSIERSTDGINFETIIEVDGAGNSVNTLSYEATDTNPIRGWSYYRLRQTDYDGQTETFNIVPVHIDSDFGISIYPNPTIDHFTLTLESGQVQTGEIVITDVRGRVMVQHEVSMREGFNQFEFDAESFDSGIYLISAIGELSGRGKTHRLVVER